jgi:hypothetical protein
LSIALAVVLFGSFAPASEAGLPCADLNGDKKVDLRDLAILARQWLEPCGPQNCDRSGFISVGEYCDYDYIDQVLYYSALTSWQDPTDELAVEIWEAAGGPTEPGTYTITDAGYDVCSLCVAVFAGCDENGCGKAFLAVSGELEIYGTGGPGDWFAGALSNVELIEVTIDPETWASTPVPDGQTWCIELFPFAAEITEVSW